MNNVVLKLEGTKCNIDCTYCYEKVKDITYNENLTLKYIEKMLNENDKFNILLHGGEPLMIGCDNMDNILKLLLKHQEKVKVVKLLTNGILLDDKWCKLFFQKFNSLNIELGISIDGNENLNYLRIDYKKNNTTKSVIKAFELIKKYNVKIGIFSVINKRHINNENIYLSFLEQYKDIISFVKFNPLYVSKNNIYSDTNILPLEYTIFLKNIYNYWIESSLYKYFVIEPIISYIQAINKVEDIKYCEFKNDKYKCFKFNTIYPNGNVTACDNLNPNSFNLGNIFNNKLYSLQQNYNKTSGINILNILNSKCELCDIKTLCGGGCLDIRQKFLETPLYEEYCIHRRDIFNFISQEIL